MNGTITLTPDQFIADLDLAMPRLSPAERIRMIAHGRAWAAVYYAESGPEPVANRLNCLEVTWRFKR